jgi:hypothetical protein
MKLQPLDLADAQQSRRCRICHEPIVATNVPTGWPLLFRKITYPPPVVVLNFGEEFAHEACLAGGERQAGGAT